MKNKRNFVTKNMAKFNKPKVFKDKKRAMKSGEVKHKKDLRGHNSTVE